METRPTNTDALIEAIRDKITRQFPTEENKVVRNQAFSLINILTSLKPKLNSSAQPENYVFVHIACLRKHLDNNEITPIILDWYEHNLMWYQSHS